ncbi:MAG: hypothetical protein MJ208_01230 [Bacilli bacterium]|nr:hypothetical protein [Bacilli bacterium]
MRNFIELHSANNRTVVTINTNNIVDFYPDRIDGGCYVKVIGLEDILLVTESYEYVCKVLHVYVSRQPKTAEERAQDKKIVIDTLHYKGNAISFWLILLTIALNIAMFIIIYKTNTSLLAADLQLGFDLIINVVFMLAAFLAAEKTKRYSRQWGYISIVLGIAQFLRIFWIPLYYFRNGGISSGAFAACVVLLSSGAASIIAAGAITLIKYRILLENEPLIKKRGANRDVRT